MYFIGWSARSSIDRPISASCQLDPTFDAMHDDPRFVALVERINARKRKDLLAGQ